MPRPQASGGFLLAAILLLSGCAAQGGDTGGEASDWDAPYDEARAAEQASSMATYGMPDDWANYGESFIQFCAVMLPNASDCKRESLGEDMSSADEIAAFDAEKNNPKAMVADIGIIFGSVASAAGVVPTYLPPSAAALPEGLKGAEGGWVATFVGVPGFIVNIDFLGEQGIDVPRTWADLAKPEYRGLVGIGQVGSSGTATMSFLAMTYAQGGSVEDLQPGIDFAAELRPNIEGVAEGNADSFERGEVPIQIKYDFNLIALASEMETKGVGAEVVIPEDGSIYAASALMINRYDEARMDAAKMFSEWVLSDEGQAVFAKFGARPIRYVIGDLELPDEAKDKWLPDEMYESVQTIDLGSLTIEQVGEAWQQGVGG